MTSSAIAVLPAFILIGAAPAFAGPVNPCPDSDADTVDDCSDNCSDDANASQNDADGDACGNRCDGDFDQSGGPVGFADFGKFGAGFGLSAALYELDEPPSAPVGFSDFGRFGVMFGAPPGPSGTTPGTTACP